MFINQCKEKILGLSLDDVQFAKRTDYTLAKSRLYTNPSDWIKIKGL